MKIKPTFFDTDGKYLDAYESHINKYESLRDSLVFRAFGTGFFHDGEISNIRVLPKNHSVELNILAPNFYVEDDQMFLSAEFVVKFLGVNDFTISSEDSSDGGSVSNVLTFLRSEFNTLGIVTESEKSGYRDNVFSQFAGKCELLMECVVEQSIFIGVCFSSFEITPKDPSLFYIIAKKSGFDFNYFSD